jgi:hypothetical protein
MWIRVITELQSSGFEAIALANPLRGLSSDAARIVRAAARQPANAGRPLLRRRYLHLGRNRCRQRMGLVRHMIAAEDQIILTQAQRFTAERAGSHAGELHAPHSAAVTQPAAVADQIAAAASPPCRAGQASKPAPQQPEL